MKFKVSRASAELFQEAWRTVGAIVTGRKNFNLAGAWGGNPPLGVHHFVVTHTIPQKWVKEGSPFTFVTDGVESAINLAKKTAGDKDVIISSADIMRQALYAELLDEINIDLVPILLREGNRLFEPLGTEPIELEVKHIIEGHGVTHMRYAVVKSRK
jgi:dihydrofolate reductase